MIDWPVGTVSAIFYGDRPVTVFRCRHHDDVDGNRCGNTARYYASPGHHHPALCAIHDITDNGGEGRLHREDFPPQPIPGKPGHFITWDGQIAIVGVGDRGCAVFTGSTGRCWTCGQSAIEHAGSVPHPKDRGCAAFVAADFANADVSMCGFCYLPLQWHV